MDFHNKMMHFTSWGGWFEREAAGAVDVMPQCNRQNRFLFDMCVVSVCECITSRSAEEGALKCSPKWTFFFRKSLDGFTKM